MLTTMKKVCFLALLLFSLKVLLAQRQEDIRINELMGINENSIIDEFGHHQPWCELMNTSYGTVNIGGMYLSCDKNHLKQYQIPVTSDMVIPPQSFLVFYLDSNNNYGVFHSNFKLKPKGTLYLVASNGKNIIDSITYSFEKPNEVYARFPDGIGQWEKTATFTPRQKNQFENSNTANEIFSKYDPVGIAVTLISISIVFIALFVLTLLFTYIGKYFSKSLHIKIPLKKSHKDEHEIQEESIVLSGEVTAAIATALYLYQLELHNEEAAVLTIKRTSKPYSPWSSKIYMLRQYPTRPIKSPFISTSNSQKR